MTRNHTTLPLAKDLPLPLDAATQTFAFLGRKGSGKTYAAGVLVECLLAAHVQTLILDTVGNWWGLRLAADGKGKGFDIPIIGGLRGDIPIEEGSGALLADTLMDSGSSAILDISQFSLAARQRFVFAFGERLWQRKKADRHPRPLHVVIEESQLIVPQIVRPEQSRMVGIFEEIIRLGRNYGIGVSMISQRPQSVNKEVLNQTECLFVYQTSGAQERARLKEWIVAQGADVDLMKELPSLQQGTGYVWSPQWLQIFKRIHVNQKRTFDSTATPKVGVKIKAQKPLAPLDLDDLRTKMADTIERAKQDDPRALRKQIAELTRERDQARAAKAVPPPAPMPAVAAEDRAELETITRDVEALGKRLAKVTLRIGKTQKRVGGYVLSVPIMASEAVPRDTAVIAGNPKTLHKPPQVVAIKNLGGSNGHVAAGGGGDKKLSSGERKILTVLAQYPAGRSKRQLALLTGYAGNGGGFGNYISALRTRGCIEGDKNLYRVLPAGLEALGDFEPMPTGEALRAHWLNQLGKAERAALSVLLAAYPEAMDKLKVAELAGYEPNTGGINNALSRLRTLDLVEGRGEMRASAELMMT